MYILCQVDGINEPFGETSITEQAFVLGLGKSVKQLQKYVEREYYCGVKTTWKKTKGFKSRIVGQTYYEGRREEKQYFVICPVKVLRG